MARPAAEEPHQQAALTFKIADLLRPRRRLTLLGLLLFQGLFLCTLARSQEAYEKWYLYGAGLESRSQYSAANQAYYNAMRLAPTPLLKAQIAKKSAEAYDKAGQADKARSYYQFYLKSYPGDAEVQAKLASAAAPPPALADPPTPWGATWRSAVIPGWGQWYRGQPVWGAVVLGAVGYAGWVFFAARSEADATYAKYTSATTPGDAETYHRYTVNQDEGAALLGDLALFAYVANVSEAYILTPNPPRRTAWEPSISPLASADSVGLRASWAF
jgi:tetratricopeptide (TPR) repeat protein